MNTIRAIVHLSLIRGYRTNRGNGRRGYIGNSQRESPMMDWQQQQQPHMTLGQFDEEKQDVEDLDEYASDFSNLAEYHRMHERELEVQKAKLKTQIVKRQYFKSEEPSMLTWGEKEQIRHLHQEDPEEWSPDKLSESFPASREAILKILRSKWLPKSTKVVENYEKKVKSNWDLFKSGKLVIDPQLRAHLAKFKDREIRIADTETMKKYIRPKPIFPQPQSSLFANVIKGYLDENKTRIETEKGEMGKLMEKSEMKITTSGVRQIAKMEGREKGHREMMMTMDQFLINHVEGVRENDISPVDRVIVDEYKTRNAEAYKSKSLVFESESAIAPWSREVEKTMERENEKNEVHGEIAKIEPQVAKKTQVRVIDENSLETGIIMRHKKVIESIDVDYPDFIKIPPRKYKPGVTYRVEDRYYDDDGVFLYRVPGLTT